MSPLLQAWRNSTHVHVHECVYYCLGLSRNVIVYLCMLYVHAHAHVQVHPLTRAPPASLWCVCACTCTQQFFFFCCAVWAHSSARDERKRECERVSVCERKLPGTRVGGGGGGGR